MKINIKAYINIKNTIWDGGLTDCSMQQLIHNNFTFKHKNILKRNKFFEEMSINMKKKLDLGFPRRTFNKGAFAYSTPRALICEHMASVANC